MKNKNICIFLLALFFGSCTPKETPNNISESVTESANTPEEEGSALVEASDCMACHQLNEKMVGPSYTEIASKYSDQEIDLLADKIISGGSGVWGEVPMNAHPGLAKEDARKMVKYILSLKK